jgi:cobalamin biosynthesis protein CobW
MASSRIPATVITGFLGSGKTTLIRHIITQAKGRRLALIVNEFGDIGMDAAMLEDCGADSCGAEDIIELANGCICCTVADDFLPSMQQLLAQTPPPDHIIIETSGLALPQPLVQAFNWPDIKSQVMLDGVVTLVDGPALADGGVVHDLAALEAQRAADEELDHESPIDELFADQIGAANLIVLSKADLLDEAGMARARAVVENQLEAATPIIPVAGGAAPMDAILGLDMEEQAHARSQHSHHHHHHHDDDHDDDHHHHEHGHDEFASRIIALGEIDDVDTFQQTIAALALEFGILRAKGRVVVSGKALPYVVQAVGRRVDGYFARDRDAVAGRLVVIGMAGLDAENIASRLGGSLIDEDASSQG